MIENKTILVIQNPVSGNRRSKKRAKYFLELLQENCSQVSIMLTDCKGAAERMVKDLLEQQHLYQQFPQ